jgi:uncharacterized glyoxalase superfamily protein PhnB
VEVLVAVTSAAVSLNVPDVIASAEFAKQHFGFVEIMSTDGVVSLRHEAAALQVIFLRTGLGTFKPGDIAGSAGEGLLVVLVLDEGLDEELARIAAAGAPVVTPPETEPSGERYCQFRDPNGIEWQLVQWM